MLLCFLFCFVARFRRFRLLHPRLAQRLPGEDKGKRRACIHVCSATDRRPGLSEKSTFQVAASPANIQKITIKKNQIEWELPTLS